MLSASVVALLVTVVHGQIYQFEQVEIPGPKSLRTLYAFYIYFNADAPSKSGDRPFITFQDFAAHSTSHVKDSLLANYEGVQVAVMPYKYFSKWINPNNAHKLCSNPEDVQLQHAKHSDQMLLQANNMRLATPYIHTVHFSEHLTAKPRYEKVLVNETGIYVLLLSNCGHLNRAVVSGTVIVKHTYGFLPGNEYLNRPFFGWISLSYALLALLWLGLSVAFWDRLCSYHYSIARVIFLGFIETFIWYIFYWDWNQTGSRRIILFVWAIVFTVMKLVFSKIVVLVAVVNSGAAWHHLHQGTRLRIQGLGVLYGIFTSIQQIALSLRNSHALSTSLVFLCLLPVAALDGAVIYWILTALGHLMDNLGPERFEESLALCRQKVSLILLLLTAAFVTLICQVVNLSLSTGETKWHYQWLCTDGVSQTIFVLALMVVMCLWAPIPRSIMYVAAQQVDDEDEELGVSAAKSSKLAPETIGAVGSGNDE